MILDRRMTQEIAQALIRARNRNDVGSFLENVTQTSTASGDGNYGEPVFGGMGFPSGSRPGVMTNGKAASQSHMFMPTPRPHPFRDPEKLSYTGDAADMAKARGIPAQDQLAFNQAPSTSSRPTNLRTTHGRPLAINATGPLQQRYWNYLWEGLFPPYCKSTDDSPTFPPLINQIDEGDKAACHEQFEHDKEQCYENHSYNPQALGGCLDRAGIVRDLCLRGQKEVSPWSDPDTDGVSFPKPRKRWKMK